MLSTLEKYYQDGLLLKQNHPNHDLTIWNYSPKVQYDRLWDDITIQCRGLVTNSKGKIIARPFKKFFNYEEHKPEDIPNEPFDVFEKMDGSLGIVFYYKGEWIVATRGSFTSEQSVVATKMFKELSIVKNYPTTGLNHEWTYLFEIIYSENRIVCKYDFEGLVLLSSYHTESGKEIEFDELTKHINLFPNIKIVRKYNGVSDYRNLKEMISGDKEGYVVKFKNGFRIKIKGDEYVRLHRILTGFSNIDIWEYLKNKKDFNELLDRVPDEFYSWVRETKTELKTQFETIEKEYKWIYEIICRSDGISERKVFAEYAKRYKHSNLLFAMYSRKNWDDIIWKIVKPKWSKPFKKDSEN